MTSVVLSLLFALIKSYIICGAYKNKDRAEQNNSSIIPQKNLSSFKLWKVIPNSCFSNMLCVFRNDYISILFTVLNREVLLKYAWSVRKCFIMCASCMIYLSCLSHTGLPKRLWINVCLPVGIAETEFLITYTLLDFWNNVESLEFIFCLYLLTFKRVNNIHIWSYFRLKDVYLFYLF